MNNRLALTSAFATAALALASSASAQSIITRFEFIDGGGVAQGASHQMTCAIGQGVVGASSSSTFTINAGFWFDSNPTPPADPRDFNGDGVIDPDDLADYISAFFS